LFNKPSETATSEIFANYMLSLTTFTNSVSLR